MNFFTHILISWQFIPKKCEHLKSEKFGSRTFLDFFHVCGNMASELCEAYEVGWDFVIAPEQQQQSQQSQSQPHQNLAASHTGEDPSCFILLSLISQSSG